MMTTHTRTNTHTHTRSHAHSLTHTHTHAEITPLYNTMCIIQYYTRSAAEN